MEQGYKVKITEQAKEQIREIVYCITVNLQTPEAAVRTNKDLQKAISSLSYFPKRAALSENEPWRSNGVRRKIVNKYLIYFSVDDEMREVYITAVVYTRRNQEKVFEKL